MDETLVKFVEKQRNTEQALFSWAMDKLLALPLDERDAVCKRINKNRNENIGATTAFIFVLTMLGMYPEEYEAVKRRAEEC